MKNVILFGATGLVGGNLLSLLQADTEITSIKVFVRKSISVNSPKVQVIITDFKDLQGLAVAIVGDAIFCALGTTFKKAGSKDAFTRVDLDLPLNLAALGRTNGINTFILISSIGASDTSSSFYLKTKGQLENRLKSLDFPNLTIVRPPLLLGERKELRGAELIFKALMKALNPLLFGPLKKYAGVHAMDVAAAMHKAINYIGLTIIESENIQIKKKDL